MITNVTRGVEKTIDNIPVVNILKRILDRYTPLQVILQFLAKGFFTYLDLILVESSLSPLSRVPFNSKPSY